MKKSATLIYVGLLFLLSSCANHNIGKPVDFYRPFSLSGSGHETVSFTSDFIMDYSYNINKEDKIITFTGTLNCKNDADNWNYSKGSIRIDFVSKEGIIKDTKTLLSWQDEELCTEKTIQSIYPFQDDFDGVTFFCRVYMEE